MALFVLMALLISSQVTDAGELDQVPSKGGEKVIGSDIPYRCPYGCCGRGRLIRRHCRCCPKPNTSVPTDPHA
ncbi:hypothetical protein AAHA92_20029 [Salvia divinorum]|uniref:Uncharacterized protein n=1 Tax=Salvia divinorum TaxID=28513 RepID=A0ABD1GFW4_SALDI